MLQYLERVPVNLRKKDLVLLGKLGLFDPDYYAAAYREAMGPSESALQHYLRTGDMAGFRPGPRFDPIIYKIRHPDSAQQNSLLHFYASHPDKRPLLRKLLETASRLLGRSAAGSAPEHWPGSREYWRVKGICGELRVNLPKSSLLDYLKGIENNPGLIALMPDACDVPVDLDGVQHRIETPAPGGFLNRIAVNQPYAFVRLPHGFWDALAAQDEAARQILDRFPERGLTEGLARRLGTRLLKEQTPDNGTFEEHMVEEIVSSIPLHGDNPSYFRSVAFKGFPTPDEKLFLYQDIDDAHRRRLKHFTALFAPTERVFDATMWKRWLITGSLRQLPDLCRPHPVILVGPDSLGGLGQAWSHPRFSMIRIPRENTQRQRHELVSQIARSIATAREVADREHHAPVVLFQCGGSFAYWLVARLYESYRDVFYLDLGQALNAWCYDVEANTDLPWNRGGPFCQLYLRTIIRNNGLESYYRERMGAGYEALLQKFPVAPVERGV